MHKAFFTFAVCLLAGATLSAQQAGSAIKPAGKGETKADFGGKTITINYGRPMAQGRKMVGGQDPYNKIWRTGANEATTLETTADLMIGDLRVPAGKYTIFTIPTTGDWTLIVNKTKETWGAYDYFDTKNPEKKKAIEGNEVGRTKMKRSSHAATEMFTISIDKKDASSGTMHFMWEDYDVAVPVKVM